VLAAGANTATEMPLTFVSRGCSICAQLKQL
jgi:hypothetical protein